MPHFNTVNRWLRELRELANAIERLQDDVKRTGIDTPPHLEQARQEVLLAIEEVKMLENIRGMNR